MVIKPVPKNVHFKHHLKIIMKKLITCFFLFFTLCMYAQEKTIDTTSVDTTVLEYTKIDYSKYGISQIFITMYENEPVRHLLQKKAEETLSEIQGIYHTLYFFIPLEPGKYSHSEKEDIFKIFTKKIIKKEGLKMPDLYLNFDTDYSSTYQDDMLKDSTLSRVKRIFINITAGTISGGLFVRQ